MPKKLSRRDFLRYTSAAAGGMALAGLTPLSLAKPHRQAGGTIEFWSQPYGDTLLWQNLLNELAGEFANETGHDVLVEIITWPNANPTWLLAAQGGAHPDVGDMFWLYSHAGIGGGQYGPMPITQYKDELWPDLEERFFERALVDVFWQGEFYGIPWRGDIRPQIVRTDLLEEAGFDRPPDTWEEIVEYAKALTVRDSAGNVTRYGFAFGSATPIQALLPYYWQAGGEFMTSDGRTATVDNDIMRETLTWMRSLVWEHEVLSPNFMERSYTVFDDFVADAVAMVGSVSDTVGTDLERDFPELDGRWEMAIPALGPDNRSSYSGAGYWGLLYGTPRVEESLQWLSFLSRDENMQRVTEFIGRVSPNKAVMASDYWQDRPWKVVITETLNHAHTSQHPSPAWGVMVAGEPGGILYDMYFDAIVRQEDLDDVLARTQSRMQEEMDKVDF